MSVRSRQRRDSHRGLLEVVAVAGNEHVSSIEPESLQVLVRCAGLYLFVHKHTHTHCVSSVFAACSFTDLLQASSSTSGGAHGMSTLEIPFM